MAKKKEKSTLNQGRIEKIKSMIQTQINSLYTNTYMSPKQLNNDSENIKNSINDTLEKILKNNEDEIGNNTYALFQRLKDTKSKGKTGLLDENIADLFDNTELKDALVPSLVENKLLKQYDEDIDTLCKFMPLMKDALDVLSNHVLCGDRFTKKYMTITNKITTNEDEISLFNSKMDSIMKRYDVEDTFKKYYNRASKYGEEYIYITTYKETFAKLLNKKAKIAPVHEEYVGIKDYVNSLNESVNISDEDLNSENNMIKVNLYNGIIPTAIKEEQQINSIHEASKLKFDNIIQDDLQFDGPDVDDISSAKKFKSTSADGLIDTSVKEDDIKINGAIVRRLPRENVIPVYIGDLCMGYYYIECIGTTVDEVFNNNVGTKNTLGFFNKTGKSIFDTIKTSNQNDAISVLSSRISSIIDTKFINNNQDLKKEIYMILQHNDIFNKSNIEINVSFIQPNQMVAMMFNEDDETHRGLSDLDEGALMGKLCASIRATSTIGILTRSFDKRIYYVKQQIDSNISQVLLNTINQLKKSNYGTREIANLKNTLNMTGRYNDLLVPVGASGDYPIQFEVLPGQEIDPKEEFCSNLEQQAVNTIAPYEYVQAESQVDFATRLTMTNIKFFNKILDRQQVVEKFASQMLQKIWDAENPTEKAIIDVKLNTPLYLSIVNNSEMYSYITQHATNIVENDIIEDDEVLRRIYKKNIIRNLAGAQLDRDMLDRVLKESKMERNAKYGNPEDEQM